MNFKLLHCSRPFKLELKKPNFTSVLKKIAVPVVDDMVDDRSANVRLRRVESFRLRASLNGKRISALGLQEIQGPFKLEIEFILEGIQSNVIIVSNVFVF